MIEKKVFWIYNIYRIVMELLKCGKSKEKSFRNRSHGEDEIL